MASQSLFDRLENFSRFVFTIGLPRVRDLPPAEAAELVVWATEKDDRENQGESSIRSVLLAVALMAFLAFCAALFVPAFSMVARVSLLALAVPCFVLGQLMQVARRRRIKLLIAARMAMRKPWCPKCDYDLRGLPGAKCCPECGEPLASEGLARSAESDRP